MFQHVSLLCCSICVRFQQSCFSIRGPTVVFQHLRFSLFHFCVAASVFASNSRVSASTFQPVSLLCCSICVCFQQSCFSIRGPTVVFQHLRFNMFHFCVAASVFASVLQRCFSTVFQRLCLHLCCSSSHLCCGSLHLYCSVFQHLFFKNNRLPSMTTLIICVISVVAIFPTISPFGIDGNMSFISPPLTSRAKG
jgi:hypothetical protein